MKILYKSKSPEIAKPQVRLRRYRKWSFDFDENQLQGKTILDIGSADSRFGEYVEQQYPDTKVLRFDVRQEPDNRVDFIARADQIPLKAETIDLALAHASIAQNSGEYVIMALEEIFSVIKKGGEIRVAPIFDAPFPYSQNRLRLAREYVNDLEKQDELRENGLMTEQRKEY